MTSIGDVAVTFNPFVFGTAEEPQFPPPRLRIHAKSRLGNAPPPLRRPAWRSACVSTRTSDTKARRGLCPCGLRRSMQAQSSRGATFERYKVWGMGRVSYAARCYWRKPARGRARTGPLQRASQHRRHLARIGIALQVRCPRPQNAPVLPPGGTSTRKPGGSVEPALRNPVPSLDAQPLARPIGISKVNEQRSQRPIGLPKVKQTLLPCAVATPYDRPPELATTASAREIMPFLASPSSWVWGPEALPR